eukprot:Skav220467  [mRNA]  locus=scaffold2597:6916:8334:+ [translate_table: standard]
MQSQEPAPVIAAAFHELHDRASSDFPLHIYTDGACQGPDIPSARFTAFACVVDLCRNDTEREQQIGIWKATGVTPQTFQVCAVGRAPGEQTINRAETAALIAAGTLGSKVLIHTDSAFAVTAVDRACSHIVLTPAKDANLDLILQLRASRLQPHNILKVKAHQEIRADMHWRDIYHIFGNQQADRAAVQACELLHVSWSKILRERLLQVRHERELLHGMMLYKLELNKVRAQAFQQLQKEESAATPRETIFSTETVRSKIGNWEPADFQVLPAPLALDSWRKFFAWGNHLVEPFFHWMVLLKWPREPGGPLSKEIGVSWLELALSFSQTIRSLLPILGPNADGAMQILWVQDKQDAINHAITFKDLAASFEMMWTQLKSYFPKCFPAAGRGRVTALQTQGFLIHSQGIGLRPAFPYQLETYDLLQLLKGQTTFSTAVVPTWCDDRTGSLDIDDWAERCGRYRSIRRKVGVCT